ncbi:MAG: alkaline phosphatase family protein [Candidatus Alcyoniella australis]|nr:alkaline phosphatase family protein [Candidatus Alcyoniella australis]
MCKPTAVDPVLRLPLIVLLLLCLFIAACGDRQQPPAQRSHEAPDVSFGANRAAAVSATDWPRALVAPEVRELPQLRPGQAIAGKPGGPLVVLGIDGADWQVLGPLLARGELPNLARILACGAYGFLETDVGYSPISWSTIACGASRDRHGVGYQTALDPQLSSRLKVPPLWEIALDRGRSVGVVQAYFGMGLPDKRGSYWGMLKWPQNEIELYNAQLPEGLSAAMPQGFAELNRSDVKAYLATERLPDLFFTIIDSLDVACHYNLHGFVAARPGAAPSEPSAAMLRAMAQRIEQTAVGIDAVLGYVWDRLPEQATLVLVSDHGQGILDLRYELRPGWAMLQALGCESIEPGQQACRIEAGTLDVRYERKTLRRPWIELRGVELPLEVEYGSIEIRPGNVDAAQYAAWADALEQSLPRQGPEALYSKVQRDGERIVLQPLDPWRAVLEAKPHEQMAQWERYPRFLANHGEANPGIVVFAGPGIMPGRTIEGARLEDVAPTALYAMGLAPADTMTGRVLSQAFSEQRLAAYPPKPPRSYARVECQAPPGADAQTLERLRSLGYLH